MKLRTFVHICAWCKAVHGDDGSWKVVEDALELYSKGPITHGICPDCLKDVYPKFSSVPPQVPGQSTSGEIDHRGGDVS